MYIPTWAKALEESCIISLGAAYTLFSSSLLINSLLNSKLMKYEKWRVTALKGKVINVVAAFIAAVCTFICMPYIICKWLNR